MSMYNVRIRPIDYLLFCDVILLLVDSVSGLNNQEYHYLYAKTS